MNQMEWQKKVIREELGGEKHDVREDRIPSQRVAKRFNYFRTRKAAAAKKAE